MYELSALGGDCAAIDFGISNTDVAAYVGGQLHCWSRPSGPELTPELVRSLLAAGDLAPQQLRFLVVTGGHSRALPGEVDGCPVLAVGEVEAIGRGGQALAGLTPQAALEPMLIVSAGSGTAMVATRRGDYYHVTGTGVGGGTLLGLARLLLDTTDPREIDELALAGNPNAADLSLADVVAGNIGRLPPSATAVNFGRLARGGPRPGREELAASLVTMVGQVIGTLAISAAGAQHTDRVLVVGRLTEMRSVRDVIESVGEFYGFPLELPPHAGSAMAVGALLYAGVRQARSSD